MTLLAIVLAASATIAPVAAQQPAPQLAGVWEGRLAVGAQSIRVVLRVDDTGAAVMDSPDQGALGIPVEGLTVEAGVARFGVAAVGGGFEGALSPDGESLTGTLRQGAAAMPLVLTRRAAGTAEAVAPARPQTPQPPFPYRAEEVTIDAPTDGVQLAGTLTVPEGDGPFPAVLLITGSGAQDRDETIFGHKPFWVLADALSRRGVAVLRVDDRGVGGSTGPMQGVTTADFARDAAAAVAWLATRPGIDPTRIGLVGHSEGGTIAPLVARMNPEIAFVVLIAGPAVRGAEVLTEQSRRIQQARGVAPAVVEANVALQARLMEAVAANPDSPQATATAVRGLLQEAGAAQSMIDEAVQQTGAAWTRWFVAHDPQPSLTAFEGPVLALYGGKDVQVPADQSAEALARMRPDARIVVLPELNHLMQTADTGLVDEYATIEETIDPEALKAVVDWVAARSGL